MPDLLPPGTVKPDYTDAHFRYLWRAQYDSLRGGPVVTQLDADGMARSVGTLDFTRIVRIELVPQWDGLPILELRCNVGEGEKAIKFWTGTVAAEPGAVPEIAEVLGVQKNVTCRRCGEVTATKFFTLHQPRDNRLVISTNPNT
jgi:hypothetical protein